MMETKYLYLIVMFASLLVPFSRSFEKRVAYFKSFKALALGVFIVSGIFLIWDIIFTHLGFWGFNPRYLSGIYLFNLPLGEWLFFIVIPFCSIFIYRVYNYFVPTDYLAKATKHISNFLIGFSVGLAVVYYDRWYTVLTFASLAALIALHKYVLRVPWLGKFYMSYAIVLVPFFIVNGILTGSGLEEEIVWYNADEMIGTRIFTVPFEDAFYGLVLILGICTLYEHFGKKWNQPWAYEIRTEKGDSSI
jgi:lycopene cyclase domain-containing protein